MKKLFQTIFIDGLSGMATGLFATLILGTILQQIGTYMPNIVGAYFIAFAGIAKVLTGAGIGMGVASKLKCSPLISVSAAVAGMVGAYAGKLNISTNALVSGSGILLEGAGEPLGAYVAAMIAIGAGKCVAGKIKGMDILLVPFFSILAGSAAGLWVGPPISDFMNYLGGIINWATDQQPLIMGIVVSVLMGMALTLPISSAAIGISLNLSGLAAGAATIGCCCNMIGFAVASYKENGIGGLFAQGFGTSMLQVPNIIRRPLIWIPAILSSAILGPIGTVLLGMKNNAIGSGMGTSGLVGVIQTFYTMSPSGDSIVVLIKIMIMHFVLPAMIAISVSSYMRKKGLIKDGDMKLEV